MVLIKSRECGKEVSGKGVVLLLMFMLLSVLCIYGYADTVELKKGAKIEGQIIEETDEFVKIELSSGGYMKVKKSKVNAITKLSAEEKQKIIEELQKKKEVVKKNRQERLEFIRWCKKHSIPEGHKKAQALKRFSERRKKEYPEEYCKVCDAIGKIVCKECHGIGKLITICKRCDKGMVQCKRCGGTGKETCYDCGGAGTLILKCRSCNGSGLVQCESCSGTGQVRCKTCNGHGTVVEYEDEAYYDQYGALLYRKKRVEKTCQSCKGRGGFDCKACKGQGKLMCQECNGSGKGVYKCSLCYGTGKLGCRKCWGLGKVKCPYCHGKGKYEKTCKVCSGKGLVPCHNCKGIGVTGESAKLEKLVDELTKRVEEGEKSNKIAFKADEKVERVLDEWYQELMSETWDKIDKKTFRTLLSSQVGFNVERASHSQVLKAYVLYLENFEKFEKALMKRGDKVRKE